VRASLLVDPTARVARAFGLSIPLGAAPSGQSSHVQADGRFPHGNLLIPATYVLDPRGQIVYAGRIRNRAKYRIACGIRQPGASFRWLCGSLVEYDASSHKILQDFDSAATRATVLAARIGRPMADAYNNPSPEHLRRELGARFQRPLMTFFLRRVKDRPLAEDLTQDVLLKVVRACERGQIGKADSYVFKVAINLLRDRRRRALRAGPTVFLPIEEDIDGQLESQLVEAISPERVLLSEESLADVLRSLEELGELTRKIFILFRLENMKQKDIAALYGIGQSTVEKHVVKAVVHLAKRYGHE